jgi:hypothetical protein
VANELTINCSMEYDDALGESMSLQVSDLVKSVTTKSPVKLIQSVGTAEEAIDLGDTGTPVYAMFKNLDPTNYIELKVATSGAIFARLDPDTDQDGKGGVALLRLGSGATAPYAIANTSACRMAIMLLPS